MKVADLLIERLARAGTRAIFGMPGGGTNLDVIDAARRRGLRFVLSHTETAGAIMASAQAEITGAPGVCLSTLGPGVSSIANGVAHAWLDRVPLLVLTDVIPRETRDRYEHQNLSHSALLGPITRLTAELTSENARELLTRAIACAMGNPPGPVHLDCAPGAMNVDVDDETRSPEGEAHGDAYAIAPHVASMLQRSRRPLMLVGLGARRRDDAAALRRVCERRGVPLLSTYKAKGVVPDDSAIYGGLFTLGEIERPIVEAADLLITVGLDPVELLPRSWPWKHPVLHCSRWRSTNGQMPAGESATGDLAAILAAIEEYLPQASQWTDGEIANHRRRQHDAALTETAGFSPGAAVSAIATGSTAARHITVDAGAHMFPAMTLLDADRPGRILISNGLSTMGYALPAAIGAALLAPDDPVVAITGDAGLLMCLGELRTAAREGVRVVVVVFADGQLSLIRIKQDRRGLDPIGVGIGDMDWPRTATALGLRASRACDEKALADQLAIALVADGPTLIEARVDPGSYGRMLETIRG
jgi:acetolactate synthase-1/2/3 large subunit